jgi:hypothetical protein
VAGVLPWRGNDQTYRDAGWWEDIDNQTYCGSCGKYEYRNIPESKVTDAVGFWPMCDSCMAEVDKLKGGGE